MWGELLKMAHAFYDVVGVCILTILSLRALMKHREQVKREASDARWADHMRDNKLEYLERRERTHSEAIRVGEERIKKLEMRASHAEETLKRHENSLEVLSDEIKESKEVHP